MVMVMLEGLEFVNGAVWGRALALSAARMGRARVKVYMVNLSFLSLEAVVNIGTELIG